MENQLNSTQPTTSTSNPQGAASSSGASNASDFQETAPSTTLQQQTENLSVQQTGDPLTGVSKVVSENSTTIWIAGVIVLLVLGAVLLYKLLKESVEDIKADEPKVAASTARKKAANTKPASKKSTAKKKSAPNQRRKKTTKKRG